MLLWDEVQAEFFDRHFSEYRHFLEYFSDDLVCLDALCLTLKI